MQLNSLSGIDLGLGINTKAWHTEKKMKVETNNFSALLHLGWFEFRLGFLLVFHFK